ncbi:hypothetical protein [Limnofasciculus baicalensis]|uniref:Uncharacterized protein n=1 Tax=Limnofasciculus baicalensis BBK-W-15 TaxID=2699891 RepID=A0AAE3GQ17_9CYAN|nr:hypothetical protein [Limnofasciculus baicalensis]MCP2727962.1 hypothetical protein [Limnofasciculus baicalensis BBK-W-15]
MPITVNYQSQIQIPEIGLSLWWRWLIATFGGFITSLFWIEIGERHDMSIIEGIIGGIAIATPQSIILKQYISQSRGWIFVTVLTWSLIGLSGLGAVGWFVPQTLEPFLRLFYGIINGAEIGLALGIAQSFILKRQIPHAQKWIWVSIISWAVGLGVGWAIGGVLRQFTRLFISDVVGLAVTWLIVGAMTGYGLMRLVCFLPVEINDYTR